MIKLAVLALLLPAVHALLFGDIGSIHNVLEQHKQALIASGEYKPTFAQDFYLDQRLDHRAPASNRTWKQRYLMASNGWQRGNPIFLLIGGEGPISEHWITNFTAAGDWGQRMGAMVRFESIISACC